MDDLAGRFTYYAPKDDQPDRYQQIRSRALEFARYIERACPKSQEQSLAFTHLEEAVMWANASIARNE